eukprot:456345-Pelagomonas_calceolata.AAC.4
MQRPCSVVPQTGNSTLLHTTLQLGQLTASILDLIGLLDNEGQVGGAALAPAVPWQPLMKKAQAL